MEESENLVCSCSDVVKENWGRKTSKDGLTFCSFCDKEIKAMKPTVEDEKSKEDQLRDFKRKETVVSGGCAVIFVGWLALMIFGASLLFGFFQP